MKKKITIIFCIIILMFNFILETSYATDSATTQDPSTTQDSSAEEQIDDLVNDIQSSPGGNTEEIFKDLQNGVTTIVSNGNEKQVENKQYDETAKTITVVTTKALTFIVEWINNIPEIVVESTQEGLDIDYFTIYSLVMGEYEIFNIDFTGIDPNVNFKDTDNYDLSVAETFKYGVLYFYYIFRNLSIGLSLMILIYIGIRMAISTLAVDKAKYKDMFISWLASIFLVFFMHIIIIVFSVLLNKALEIIRNLATQFGISNIEEGILAGTISNMGTSVGFHPLTSLITVALFVYYEVKFFMAYMRRTFEIIFLTVISPLVTITYSIDKVSDNKAQAFQNWLKELSVKYSIQVVHALTYCVLIASAGVIAQEVPIFAAFFLLALDKAESIFRKIFDVKEEGFKNAKVPFIGGNK